MTKYDYRLSNKLDTDLQKLRCRVNYHALRFTDPIQELGEKLIQRMREKSRYFIALHLRYSLFCNINEPVISDQSAFFIRSKFTCFSSLGCKDMNTITTLDFWSQNDECCIWLFAGNFLLSVTKAVVSMIVCSGFSLLNEITCSSPVMFEKKDNDSSSAV